MKAAYCPFSPPDALISISATSHPPSMKIPDNLLAQFQDITRKYPVKRSALIPILMATQEEFGYIPPELIAALAEFVEVPEIDVHEVITFYSMLRTRPVGKHHIQVCTNISCMLLGGDEIFSQISEKLGIGEGEATPDGQFSLTEVECLGACCNAPAMQINYDYHDDLTPEKVDDILKELEKQS
ncbi:MAG: NADH-quinone oxidoreductase subunit NuoE [Terriglobia bacterium]